MYIKQMTFTPNRSYIHKVKLENQTYLSLVFQFSVWMCTRPPKIRENFYNLNCFPHPIQHSYNATVQSVSSCLFSKFMKIFCSLHSSGFAENILYVGNRICSNTKTKAEKTIYWVAYSVKELDYVASLGII